ncbi:MAG: RcnB family protein [Pararhizobium sp.]
MKRFVIAVTALSMLAPAAAFAAPRHDDHKPPHGMHKPMHRGDRHWSRGHALPSQYRGHSVDYHRYHLRRPGHGQRWVRVGNEYLLITIASGVIASVVAAQ